MHSKTPLVNPVISCQSARVVAAMIRGITIGLSTNVRLLAEDFGRRGSLSRLAMRGTPFGPPLLPGGSGGMHRTQLEKEIRDRNRDFLSSFLVVFDA
jgi:hypothetical protein